MFPPQTYVQRRSRLQETFDSGLLLFLGNEESPMNYTDNTNHFRQDSSFLYYWGVDDPNLAAVFADHLAETRDHAELLEARLGALGAGGPSRHLF